MDNGHFRTIHGNHWPLLPIWPIRSMSREEKIFGLFPPKPFNWWMYCFSPCVKLKMRERKKKFNYNENNYKPFRQLIDSVCVCVEMNQSSVVPVWTLKWNSLLLQQSICRKWSTELIRYRLRITSTHTHSTAICRPGKQIAVIIKSEEKSLEKFQSKKQINQPWSLSLSALWQKRLLFSNHKVISPWLWIAKNFNFVFFWD